MKSLIKKSVEKSISYTAYRDLVDRLLLVGKSTGKNQSEALTKYSFLNSKRMKRLDKTTVISDATKIAVRQIDKAQTWLVLTEGWCGDAAQNLPIINKIASENKNIVLKIILRDEHSELMDLFLTNGGRAIPKLLVLDDNYNVLSTWGPRPKIAAEMVAAYKEKNGSLDDQFKQDLQMWYYKNKGQSLQEDFVSMLNKNLY